MDTGLEREADAAVGLLCDGRHLTGGDARPGERLARQRLTIRVGDGRFPADELDPVRCNGSVGQPGLHRRQRRERCAELLAAPHVRHRLVERRRGETGEVPQRRRAPRAEPRIACRARRCPTPGRCAASRSRRASALARRRHRRRAASPPGATRATLCAGAHEVARAPVHPERAAQGRGVEQRQRRQGTAELDAAGHGRTEQLVVGPQLRPPELLESWPPAPRRARPTTRRTQGSRGGSQPSSAERTLSAKRRSSGEISNLTATPSTSSVCSPSSRSRLQPTVASGLAAPEQVAEHRDALRGPAGRRAR